MLFTVCLELTTKKTYLVQNNLADDDIVLTGQFDVYEVKETEQIAISPNEYLALREEVIAEIYAIDSQIQFYRHETELINGWLTNPSTIDKVRFPAGMIPDALANQILYQIMDYRERLFDNRSSLQLINERICLAKKIDPRF